MGESFLGLEFLEFESGRGLHFSTGRYELCTEEGNLRDSEEKIYLVDF